MIEGYMYILECSNGAYYTGSTKDLKRRLGQHENGEGANFTKKHLPVKLVYYEVFQRIDDAFYREKQVQGWSREKKEALIQGFAEKLHDLSECKNDTHYKNAPFDFAPFDSAQGAAATPRSLSEAEMNKDKPEKSAPLDAAPVGSAQGAAATPHSLSEAEMNKDKPEKSAPFDAAPVGSAQGAAATPHSLSEAEMNKDKPESKSPDNQSSKA